MLLCFFLGVNVNRVEMLNLYKNIYIYIKSHPLAKIFSSLRGSGIGVVLYGVVPAMTFDPLTFGPCLA